MTVQDLKTWIETLPDSIMDYSIVNGELGEIEGTEYTYRLDKPIASIILDEESKEMIILNEKSDDGRKKN